MPVPHRYNEKPVKNENGEYDFSLTDEPIYRTLYKIIEGKKNIKWFGSLRNENDNDIDENEREKISKLLQEKNLYLFEIDKEIYKKVLVLTQEILEPLFHYAQVKSPIMEDFKNGRNKKNFEKLNTKLSNLMERNLKLGGRLNDKLKIIFFFK